MKDELKYRFTLPSDEDLDEFDSGVDEVTNYFRKRVWFSTDQNAASPPTYTFVDGAGNRIGYAAVAFRKCPHPNDKANEKKRYLVVYVVGVDRTFHGQVNAQLGETYARTIFRTLTRFAEEKDGCEGLSLWVRTDNERAIAFYKKVGFVSDETGPIARDNGTPHLTMRKVLD